MLLCRLKQRWTRKQSAPSTTTAVTAPQAPLPKPTEPATLLTTAMEEVDKTITEPLLEEANEQPPAPTPAPTAENQGVSALEPPSPLESETETSGDSSADMVYVPGFGWIESQGPNQVIYADNMYENGNKIGIMG